MESWIELDPNPKVTAKLQSLDKQSISDFFPQKESRLEFGTAGLRAAFGPGYLRMNDVIVMQTCFGLQKKLELQFGVKALQERGIVIGYDHRQDPEWNLSSRRFAILAGLVFSQYKVHIFDQINPTPFVPFAVQHFRALAGFMFTASHNPKQDAGFKVYWDNACQIISPLDDEIAALILENALHPDLLACFALAKSTGDETLIFEKYFSFACKGLFSRIQALYVDRVKSELLYAKQSHQALKICYTAMHGCGKDTVDALCTQFSLRFESVPQQAEPDYRFPTVPFPNPEEKGALQIAMDFAAQSECELILANDPDADRLGVAERSTNSNAWNTLSGDEIAILFAWWTLMHSDKSKRRAMVVSAVSSGFVQKMASSQGVDVVEALTGFKWIGNTALRLRSEGKQVLFSYEEAIGFCLGSVVCDKDGMSAAMVFAQLYLYLKQVEKISCVDKLDQLRRVHGYFMTQNGYVKLAPRIQGEIFARLRQSSHLQLPSDFSIVRVRDLETRVDTQTGKEPDLPYSKNMISYYLQNGERITLRASGTEPKLKYYVECQAKTRLEAESRCEEIVQNFVLKHLLDGMASKL